MVQTRKRVSILSLVTGAENVLREQLIERPRAWLVEAREKMRDLPKTNFELGCYFSEQGKWHDALFRFRVALYLRPNYPQALYNIGCCYFNLGNMAKARETLQQVLRETPTNSDAVFMLGAIDPNALTPEQRPKQMPRELVNSFFTSVAERYNQIEAQNQYRGGVLVAEQLKPLLAPSDVVIADLGCGTGIASIPYRAGAREIMGVDFTPAIVQQAQAIQQGDKKLLDRVVEADIASLGDAIAAASVDVVLLVNVVQFVGALDAVLATASRIAKAGALVAVTVEPYAGQDGFGLVANTGRFGHSAAYVKQVAAQHQLVAAKQTALNLYPESTAELIIFRKGAV